MNMVVITVSLAMISYEVEAMARRNNAHLARKIIAPHNARINACLAWIQDHGI